MCNHHSKGVSQSTQTKPSPGVTEISGIIINFSQYFLVNFFATLLRPSSLECRLSSKNGNVLVLKWFAYFIANNSDDILYTFLYLVFFLILLCMSSIGDILCFFCIAFEQHAPMAVQVAAKLLRKIRRPSNVTHAWRDTFWRRVTLAHVRTKRLLLKHFSLIFTSNLRERTHLLKDSIDLRITASSNHSYKVHISNIVTAPYQRQNIFFTWALSPWYSTSTPSFHHIQVCPYNPGV